VRKKAFIPFPQHSLFTLQDPTIYEILTWDWAKELEGKANWSNPEKRGVGYWFMMEFTDAIVLSPRMLRKCAEVLPATFVPSKTGDQPLADEPGFLESVIEECEEEGEAEDTTPWRDMFRRFWLKSQRAELWASHLISFNYERPEFKELLGRSQLEEEEKGFLILPSEHEGGGDQTKLYPEDIYSAFPKEETEHSVFLLTDAFDEGDNNQFQYEAPEEERQRLREDIRKEEDEKKKKGENQAIYLTEEEILQIDNNMPISIAKLLETEPSAIAYIHQLIEMRGLHHTIFPLHSHFEEPLMLTREGRVNRFLMLEECMNYSWKVTRKKGKYCSR